MSRATAIVAIGPRQIGKPYIGVHPQFHTSIKESCSQYRPTLLNDLVCHLNNLDSNQIKFIWIPSHIAVIGNDRADALAKEALSIGYVNSTDYLEFEELFTLIKMYIINKWQLEYYNNDSIG